jgi:hypothetical protein
VGAAVGLGFLIFLGCLAFLSFNQRRKKKNTRTMTGSTGNGALNRQAAMDDWVGQNVYQLQPVLKEVDLK